MRSVTMFLLESSWDRDFSCLSISSSTFSRQEGAMSLVEDSMMPSRNSTWGFSSLARSAIRISRICWSHFLTSALSRSLHSELKVSLSLELGGGVDLVSHDSGNGLLHILHPLGHLQMPHLVHLLDEGIVLLPEGHCAVCLNPVISLLKGCSDPWR